MSQDETELLVCTEPQILCGDEEEWGEHLSAEGRYLSDWNRRMCELADYSPDPPDCMVIVPKRRPDYLNPPGYAHPENRRDAGINLHAGETLEDLFGDTADFVRQYSSNGEDFAERYATWEASWRESRRCSSECGDLLVWFPIACEFGRDAPWPEPTERQRIVVPEVNPDEVCMAREAAGSEEVAAESAPAPRTPNNVCSSRVGIIDGKLEWEQYTLAECQAVRLTEIIVTYSVVISADLQPRSIYNLGDGEDVQVGCQYDLNGNNQNLTVNVAGNRFRLDPTGSLQFRPPGAGAYQPAYSFDATSGVLGGDLAQAHMEFEGKQTLTSFDINVTVNSSGEIVMAAKTRYTVTVKIGSEAKIVFAVSWEARVHINPALEASRAMQCMRIRRLVPRPVLRRVPRRSVGDIVTDWRFIAGVALLGLALLFVWFPPAAIGAAALAAATTAATSLTASTATQGTVAIATGVAVAVIPLASE